MLRAGRFADVQLYVDLHGFDPDRPPTDPGAVLDAFLRQLGVPGRQIPDTGDERAAMFRDRMHGRDAVLLLDNAADARQIQPLLPASPTCFVLVTSRRTLADLEGAAHLALDVFGAEEALALLESVVGAARTRAEPEAAARIGQACGWLPLAVSIAAARLKSHPSWSLAELADRLRGRPGAIVSAERSLRAVFDLSYRGLDPSARRLFRAVGEHPGNDFTAGSAAALAGIEPESAERLLEELLDENLLSQRTFGRYLLHDLLRQYARQLAETDSIDDLAAARRRLLDYYLHASHRAAMVQAPGRDPITVPVSSPPPPGLEPLPDAQAASEWFDAEFEALRELIDGCAGSEPVIAWQLAWSVVGHCMKTARSADLLALQTTALHAAEAAGNIPAMIYSLQARTLARSQTARNDLQEAVADLERSVELCRAVGDRFYEARGLSNIAAVSHRLGDSETCLTYAELGLAAARALGSRGRTEQARSLNLIGWSQAHLGYLDKAIASCREAVELAEEVGDPWTHGVALDSLAFAHREAGDFAESARTYRRAAAVHQDNGAVLFRARTLTHLADLHELAGEPEAALAVLAEALPTFEAVDEQATQDVRQRIARLSGSGSPAGS
jgi:tetratricopeptide (TPR) repeat protein